MTARRAAYLQQWGRGRQILFETGEDGHLLDGIEVERVLVSILRRSMVALAAWIVGMLAGMALYAWHDRTTEYGAAGAIAAGVAGQLLLLRSIMRPYREGGTVFHERATVLEDYVSAAARGIAWLVAVTALAAPIGALALAHGTLAHAERPWWPGLVVLPAAGVVGVARVEGWCRRLVDRTPDQATQMLWDAVRSGAVRQVLATSVAMIGLGWVVAVTSLAWDASGGTGPDWARGAVPLLLAGAGVVLLAALWIGVGDATRWRRRLWPDLRYHLMIPFGAGSRRARG